MVPSGGTYLKFPPPLDPIAICEAKLASDGCCCWNWRRTSFAACLSGRVHQQA